MPKSSLTPQRVREIRQKLDKTQAQLAGLIEVSVHTVRAWESGERLCVGPACRLLMLLNRDPERIQAMLRMATR